MRLELWNGGRTTADRTRAKGRLTRVIGDDISPTGQRRLGPPFHIGRVSEAIPFRSFFVPCDGVVLEGGWVGLVHERKTKRGAEVGGIYPVLNSSQSFFFRGGGGRMSSALIRIGIFFGRG